MRLFLGILAVAFSSALASTSCGVSDSAKVDCGFVGIDQNGCESKGCCWSQKSDGSSTPWCFYGIQEPSGYSLSNFVETASGFSGDLSLIGAGNSNYGEDLKNLRLDITFETADTVRVKITDKTQGRWEIPDSVMHRSSASAKPVSTNFKFSYSESPFSFEITRVSDGQSLFKSSENLVFKNQYLEITTSFDANAKTFGLGESTRLNHALLPKTYSMWAADIGALSFDRNLYGSFPFYLQLINGKAHGALLLNSNGIDAVLNTNSLTFKTIGGIFDLYVFSGPSPAEVVSQYTSVVGRPTMFPYWSLGFHNCKYGYKSVWEVEQVVANYSAANIPLDTQWMDIDYMQNYRDFTVDSEMFPQTEVSKFVDQLHDNGQHFVPIVDPGKTLRITSTNSLLILA
jgi:alpha-glucosidase (family GH31 glycosyl hydrolase)